MSSPLPYGSYLLGGVLFLTFESIPVVYERVYRLSLYEASPFFSSLNYVADTFGPFASSALAALPFCLNMLGGAFPLITTVLFHRLGEARAGSMLGGSATALGVVPWVLVFFGEKSVAEVCLPW